MPTQHDVRIGGRLRIARKRAGLTQQAVADALGLRHRQILGRIESGERRLSAQELIDVMGLLGVDLDYFTDPFRLDGEGHFSFRTNTNVADSVLDDFEHRAGRWIALYRELSAEQGHERRWLEFSLALTEKSSFEDAQAAGEYVADRWQLGSCPAARLQSAMEGRASILVLDIDTPPGISGAASQTPGVNCALVNRRDSQGRRNFDLAHELFHLLTWTSMPPSRTEAADFPRKGKGWRVEKLAENFAAALLMPEKLLRDRWEAQAAEADVHDRILGISTAMRVSGVACKWRLHDLDLLSKAEVDGIDHRRIGANGRVVADSRDRLPFSRPFITRIATALDTGRLSVKRAASLLELPSPDLASLLEQYGHETHFEA